MKIHVTEEARHLSFARHYLKDAVAGMGRAKKAALTRRHADDPRRDGSA